jgi:hypothetical protein
MERRKFEPSRGISVANVSDTRPCGALFSVVLLALACVLALPADASVLRGLTVGQLRSGSDAIVVGKVTGVRSVYDGRTIETVVRVRVAAVHKGEAGRIVTVRFPGGIARGKRLTVPGAPLMGRGDQVLLFLYRAEGQFRPVGLFQGVWKIDPSDTDSALAGDPGGASLLRSSEAALAVDRQRRQISQLVGGSR